ncbi:MAG: anti-sigma factor antagonist [Ruminococcus sp.]|nr:anti-sigma factor antagonist [Ruminococcus sp.]
MKTTNENNTLTIFLEGRIDSNNAAQTENEIMSALDSAKAENVIVDTKDLEYISSAGLRTLMKLRKAIKKPLPMVNVSRDIYEILDTTGFTELFDVKKAMREISIDGCEQIASGGQGKIYRIDDETIVKVFCNGGVIPLEYVKEELDSAKAAFVAGVPTAISFDTVKCGEYYGIVYEMIDSKTLSKAVFDEPEKLGEFAGKYAQFMKDFQDIHVPGEKFRQARDIYNKKIEMLKDWLNEDELAVMHEIADCIPLTDTLIHGDPHSGNIMIKDGELMFIDMTEVCYGPKCLDNGAIFRDLISAAQSTPQACEISMGLSAELALKLGQAFFAAYTGITDPEKLGEYLKTAGLYCAFNISANCGAYAAVNEMARQKAPYIVENLIRGILIPNKDSIKYLISSQ